MKKALPILGYTFMIIAYLYIIVYYRKKMNESHTNETGTKVIYLSKEQMDAIHATNEGTIV